jgi:translation initiation factor 4B
MFVFCFQPYTAYVANLSYDIDEEDVIKFFSKLKIKGVRLPRDGDPETGRLKGFGYADFDDRDSLVEALSMNDHLLKNRKVRIDLATHAGRGDQVSFI